MTEVVILEEMVSAGVEQLTECEKKGLSKADTCIAVYMAMLAIREIADLPDPKEVIH